MIEITLIVSFIIGIVVFVIFRRKETVTYSGTVTMESIKEVSRLITHESYISDFVTLLNTKGTKIALLHIDAKVQITFDLKQMKFKEGTSIIDFFPEPDVVAIENVFTSKLNDESYEQTEFILLEKAIYISRTNLEKVEKAFFENYKKRPSVIEEIQKAKQNFLLDINSFAQAMGGNFKIEFSEKLKKEHQIIENELETITEDGTNRLNTFNYTIKDSDIVDSTEAEFEFNRLSLFIGLIKIDKIIHTSEDKYIKDAINNSILLGSAKSNLLKKLSDKSWYDQIGKGVIDSVGFIGKHTSAGFNYLLGTINLKPNTSIEKKCKDVIIDPYSDMEYFITFLMSNTQLNIELLKQDNEIANQIIKDLFFIANLDKVIKPEELGFIRGAADILEVKSELVKELTKKYCENILEKMN